MPKIIKNGVTYIGTSDNAAAVSYDNTSSGLNATDVQGAIDEVNSGLADKMDKTNPTGSGKMLFNAASDSTGGTGSVCLSYNSNAKTTYSACIGGHNLVSGRANQTVFGIYNEENASSVVVVGWGSSTTPKNIFTLSTTGAGDFASTIEATGLGATLKQAVIDAIYPVGSIYMTVSDDTAAKVKARFGGTWVAWGSGRVPIGVKTSDADFATVEKTGGGKTTPYTPEGTNESIALTAAQLPKIKGTINFHGASDGSGGIVGSTTGVFNMGKDNPTSSYASNKYKTPADLTNHTGAESSNQAFLSFGSGSKHTHKFTGTAHDISTVQPYITCYMWKRTA